MDMKALKAVAPITGAWIETKHSLLNWFAGTVAPITGAWIETHFIERTDK